MPNFRALIQNGFYSNDYMNRSIPVSIRYNNPGAVNGNASWIKTYPGFLGATITTPGNPTALFETPEQGVAAWYHLMTIYRGNGAKTVRQIINRYGGSQDYSAYVKAVVDETGIGADEEIRLSGDDNKLLKFAKAMFRHEAGRPTPLSDRQILHGFDLARGKTAQPPAVVPPTPPPMQRRNWFIEFLFWLFGRKTIAPQRLLKQGMIGEDVKQLQLALQRHGFKDLIADGEFGAVTDQAVRNFQERNNLDPDGEVWTLTLEALNRAPGPALPPLAIPPASAGAPPSWYVLAEKDIGFRETGVNRGIDKFIASAKAGRIGDPYCAIWINAKFEDAGYDGTRSAAARSFERHAKFYKLSTPALGCVVTMWRQSPSSGLGHVFLYDGENEKGVRGIGANENDAIRRSFHERSRITGYWWHKDAPAPQLGKIAVNSSGPSGGTEV